MFFDWQLEHEGGVDHPQRMRMVHEQPRLEREWAAQQRLIALILWRVAYDQSLLVDDVTISDTALYYGRALGAKALRAGPVPEAAQGVLEGDGPSSEDLSQAAAILDGHAVADAAVYHRVGSFTTVGYRIRALRSTRGWPNGDWATSVELARKYRKSGWESREDGRWQVTPQDRQAAAAAMPAEPTYDYPTVLLGKNGYRLWLQEAHYLLSVGATLNAVAATLPRTADGYIGPLAMVLEGHGACCLALRESAHDIEQLWAAEPVQPTDLSYWDLSYVPDSLHEQTQETRHLIGDLRVWLSLFDAQ